MAVWQGVAMHSLKFHPGLPCPTLLWPAGKPPLKWPHNHFRGGLRLPSAHKVAGLWPSSTPLTPHALRLWSLLEGDDVWVAEFPQVPYFGLLKIPDFFNGHRLGSQFSQEDGALRARPQPLQVRDGLKGDLPVVA
jgi:hypothetical protein